MQIIVLIATLFAISDAIAPAISYSHGALGYGGPAGLGYAAAPIPVAHAPVGFGYAGHGHDIDYYVSSALRLCSGNYITSS